MAPAARIRAGPMADPTSLLPPARRGETPADTTADRSAIPSAMGNEGGGEAGPDGALGNAYDAAVDKAPWGNLVSESEESEEEEDPEDGNDQKDDGTESSVDLGDLSGTETPSGMTSVTSTLASGLDTRSPADLRKRSSAMSRTDGADTPESSALLPQAAPLAEEPPKQLYHVVEQQQVGVGNSHLFESIRPAARYSACSPATTLSSRLIRVRTRSKRLKKRPYWKCSANGN